MKTLSKYVTFSITVLIVYTVVEFLSGTTHDTLTTCVFAFFGTEIGSCCLIQITKQKKDASESWDELEVNEEDAEG